MKTNLKTKFGVTMVAIVLLTAGTSIMGCGSGGSSGGSGGNGNPGNNDNRDNDTPITVQYTLTTNVNPAVGGTVSPSGTTDYNAGTSVTLTAEVADGYEFVNWTGAGIANPNNATTTISMVDNRVVIANFKSVNDDDTPHTTYSLMTNANPEIGGEVTPAGTTEHNIGDDVTITAVANEGYVFTNWLGDGIEDNESETTTVSMSENRVVIANFAELPTYTLTLTADPAESGTVSKNPEQENYYLGTNVTITAQADIGYEFVNWTGVGVANANNATTNVSMSENRNIVANFRQLTYTLTANVVPTTGGTVSRTPSEENYPHGTEVTITANAEEGYAFVNWVGAGVANTENATTTISMTESRTVTAIFRDLSADRPTSFALMTDVNPSTGGAVTPAGTTTQDADADVAIVATANDGYEFVNWSGDGIADVNSASTTVSMTDNRAVIANFRRVYLLTADISPTGGGTITRSPERERYTANTEITLTAEALDGYQFVGWVGAPAQVNASNASITFNMPTNDLALTANFQRMHTLTVDRNITAGGNVSVNNGANNPTPATFAHGTSVTVSATAATGYRFTGWSGASESTNPTITIEIDDDVELTANFVQTHTLTITRTPTAGGSVTVNGTTPTGNSTTHDSGSEVEVCAIANNDNGYLFSGWDETSSSTDACVTITINSNQTLTANFELQQHTLTVNRNLTAGGNVRVNNGANNPGPASFTHGTSVTVTAIAATGYRFTRWTGASTSTNATITFAMNGDRELTANFELIPTYAVTVSSVGTGATGGGSYTQGATVNIFAGTAPAGQRFRNWTTASAGVTFANANSATTSFTMPANAVTVTANFESIPTFAVTVSSTGTGAAGSGNYVQGATVSISAGTPPANHTFRNWTTASAGVTFANANSATTTFTMPANAVTVTANFDLQLPATPTGVSASATSTSSITVTWNAVSGATGYSVFRSTSSSGTFTLVGSPTTTSFNDAGLSSGTTYWYRVAARNSAGTGTQSSSVSATTQQILLGACTFNWTSTFSECLSNIPQTECNSAGGSWSSGPCPPEPLGFCRLSPGNTCIPNVTRSDCINRYSGIWSETSQNCLTVW